MSDVSDMSDDGDGVAVFDSLRAELTAALVALNPDRAHAVPEPVRPSPTCIPETMRLTATTPDGTATLIGTTPIVIGRPGAGVGRPGVDLPVDDPHVSRRHAEIWADGELILCRDLGATNGTFRLRDGECLPVGDVAAGATVLQTGDALVTVGDLVLATISTA
ncbi:MAG: FHA domain-containing protein [Ilumatobacteraceae bacterium]